MDVAAASSRKSSNMVTSIIHRVSHNLPNRNRDVYSQFPPKSLVIYETSDKSISRSWSQADIPESNDNGFVFRILYSETTIRLKPKQFTDDGDFASCLRLNLLATKGKHLLPGIDQLFRADVFAP